MRYLIYVFGSFIACGIFYFSIIFALFPTPVAAEYWVRELLVFKRHIAKSVTNQPKIIIASGSSTLFNIDTNLISRELGSPAINLGLMGGLPLETILEEIRVASTSGDLLILALEPDYYCREENSGYAPWQIRNAIAWNHEFWSRKSIVQKLALIPALGPLFPLEMIQARLDETFRPAVLAPRLAALDDKQIVEKFLSRPAAPQDPIYSVYNMDNLGNLRAIHQSEYSGPAHRADENIKICPQTFKELSEFVAELKSRDINVVFANTPYISVDDIDNRKLAESSSHFESALKKIAPVIDTRAELIFPRDHFFDSVMHLNSTGRERRTQLLLTHLKTQQLAPQSR